MSNLIKEAHEQVRELVMKALGECVSEGVFPAEPIPSFNVEIPADPKNGDISTNAAMVCARAFRTAPRNIADQIVKRLYLGGSFFERCEVAGAGFINFFLAPQWFSEVVASVIAEGGDYGRTQTGHGKKVLVEFVSANPTGPMHIGNARGGAIGDCLASVLEKAGYEVSREFYVNDAGNQIEKFKTSLEVRYLQLYKPDIQMPEDAYLGEDITAHAKNFAKLYGDKYVSRESGERRQALCDYALPINIANLEKDLGKYRITYDKWFKESELHNNGAVKDIIEKLKASGYTYEQEGALWFRSSELGDDKDRVLVRANGVPTYLVPDIAYHYNKLVTRGYDIAIDILGADHHGYIPRMKAAMTALGINADRLDMVIMQMVNLVRNGEKYKLSKRSGKAVTLSTLLEEIPIDAARFFFNLREPNSQFDFDLDLAVSQTSQNPVYYVQYAHARICSVLRKLEEEGIEIKTPDGSFLSQLKAPEELEIIKYMATLPNAVDESARNYDPAKMTRYAVELATMYHKFYTNCRVMGEPDDILQARVSLSLAVKQVISNILDMLKITCPKSM
ncbi:arginine--tRNA ligase [Ruminococcus sp. Marseille-P6503]|uniref:arginine--tRNA ligase n=1 Tax=Ruminococcus sp. Marseille-P6503 TaxID=2364796 RepID=UPI000F5418EE|nr:arginine--tRNA ligase [Ruminococcus sp. Marseille-P6503]